MTYKLNILLQYKGITSILYLLQIFIINYSMSWFILISLKLTCNFMGTFLNIYYSLMVILYIEWSEGTVSSKKAELFRMYINKFSSIYLRSNFFISILSISLKSSFFFITLNLNWILHKRSLVRINEIWCIHMASFWYLLHLINT